MQPLDEVGLSLWGAALVCLGGLLEADLGSPLTSRIMNSQK